MIAYCRANTSNLKQALCSPEYNNRNKIWACIEVPAHNFRQMCKSEACVCQHGSIGSPIGTVFQANVTQTEQKGDIDKIKLLFIVAAIVCPYILC